MNKFRQSLSTLLLPAAAVLSLFLASCRKDLAQEPGPDSEPARPSAIARDHRPTAARWRPNEAIIVYPEGLSDGQRKEVEAILRHRVFGNIRLEVSRCICDPGITTFRGRGADRVVDSLIINGPGSQLSPTSTTVKVSGPGGGKIDVVVSKNLEFRNGSPASRPRTFAPFAYTGQAGKLRVAVIDTGLDTLRYFPAYAYSRFLLPASAFNYKQVGITNPSLINRSRYFGWNFIRNNQNIMDDHAAMKHGTNVTGLILHQTPQRGPAIIPLKAFDSTGNTAMSHLLCALRFAELAGARVINASWGYYGEVNFALDTVVNRLNRKHILLVAAAGNDRVNLDSISHYPASFSAGAKGYPNIITVTTATSLGIPAGNNYSALHVDAAVSGRVNATGMLTPFSAAAAWLPSCTSFSTAVMTGLIVRNFPYGFPSGGSLKEKVLGTILPAGKPEPLLLTKVRTGKRVGQ